MGKMKKTLKTIGWIAAFASPLAIAAYADYRDDKYASSINKQPPKTVTYIGETEQYQLEINQKLTQATLKVNEEKIVFDLERRIR